MEPFRLLTARRRPRLEKREGVVPFSNVLTQSNATHKSVPIILSPASAANYDSIYVQKSLITASRRPDSRLGTCRTRYRTVR